MAIAKTVVLREFAPVGKYRVRVIRSERGKHWIDIREFVKGVNWEGYTRKGIRIMNSSEARLLREALDTIESEQLLGE